MTKVFVLIISLIVVSTQAQSDEYYCYSTDTIKPQLAMFSTKTSYESVRGSLIDPNVSGKF